MAERACRIFHYHTSHWANFPMKSLFNTSSFWGRDIVVWLVSSWHFPVTFCADGIWGISSFRETGTFGTGRVGDTSIGSGGDTGTSISNASYINSIGNSSLSFCVISLIYFGLNWFKCLSHSNLLRLSIYITLPSDNSVFSKPFPTSVISEENRLMICKILSQFFLQPFSLN